MAKYNIADKIYSVLKTSTKMQRDHYISIAEEFRDKLEVAGKNRYEIEDVSYSDYEKTKDLDTFGHKAALFVKGYWNFVLKAGLEQE